MITNFAATLHYYGCAVAINGVFHRWWVQNGVKIHRREEIMHLNALLREMAGSTYFYYGVSEQTFKKNATMDDGVHLAGHKLFWLRTYILEKFF